MKKKSKVIQNQYLSPSKIFVEKNKILPDSEMVPISLEDFKKVKNLEKTLKSFKKEHEVLQRQQHELKEKYINLYKAVKQLEEEKKELEQYKTKYKTLQKMISQIQRNYNINIKDKQ
ncbi:hypothetical protein ABE222_06465 [Bacillus tropicus]|uniref:hypothetical protein n=1 Tax=Bacillus tropicus TaxID=2026188 RepID=UPI003D19CD5B